MSLLLLSWESITLIASMIPHVPMPYFYHILFDALVTVEGEADLVLRSSSANGSGFTELLTA